MEYLANLKNAVYIFLSKVSEIGSSIIPVIQQFVPDSISNVFESVNDNVENFTQTESKAFEMLLKDPNLFWKVKPWNRTNEIIHIVLNHDPSIILENKKDKDYLKILVRVSTQRPDLFEKCFGEEIETTSAVINTIIEEPSIIPILEKHCNEILTEIPEIAWLNIVDFSPQVLQFIPKRLITASLLKSLQEIYKEKISKNPELLEIVDIRILGEKIVDELQWMAVIRKPMLLRYCINSSFETCIAAVTGNGFAFKYINKSLSERQIYYLFKCSMKKNWLTICFIPMLRRLKVVMPYSEIADITFRKMVPDTVYYWTMYFLFYHFSGAHNKPTSDKEYNPHLEHLDNFFYKRVREFESEIISDEIKQQPLKIPVLEENNWSQENFKIVSNFGKTPVVLKGLLKESNAVKKWSAEYFKTTDVKDTIVPVLIRSKEFENRNAYTSFTQKLEFEEMSVQEAVEKMEQEPLSPYINNITKIFLENEYLTQDLELHKLEQVSEQINDNTWLKINMFMGGRETRSSLHCAAGGNFFCNIVGKKKWTLIHPSYSRQLKTTPAKNFMFVISGYSDASEPEISHIPRYQVTLEPGDVLYNPPWWWHQVDNETEFTIGCAVRDHTQYYSSWLNNPMYMAFSPYWLKLHPQFLRLAEWYFGRNNLLKISGESEKSIISNLT